MLSVSSPMQTRRGEMFGSLPHTKHALHETVGESANDPGMLRGVNEVARFGGVIGEIVQFPAVE